MKPIAINTTLSLLFSAGLMSASVSAFAQSVAISADEKSIGLSSIFRKAYDFDPEFIVSKSDQRIANADVLAAQLAYLPTFAANYGQSPIENRVRTTFQISQPILDLKKFATLQSADSLEIVAKANFLLAEQTLASRVLALVLELIKVRENLENNEEQIRTLDAQLVRAKRRLALNQGTVTEVSSTQVRSDQAKANRQQLLLSYATFERQYQAMTGLLPQPELLRFATDLAAPRLPTLAEVAALAKDNSPKVIAANAQVRLAELEQRKVMANYLPQVDYVIQQTKIEGEKSDTFSGLNLSVPVGVSPSNIALQRKAIFAADRAEDQLRVVTTQVGLEAQQAAAQLRAGVSEVQIRKKVVASAERAVQANLKGFDAGIVTSNDVLSAILTLFDARREYVNSLATLASAYLQVQLVSGVSNEAALRAVEDMLMVQTTRRP